MNQDKSNNWLLASKLSGQLIEKMSDAILLLKGKRITLEEKAIALYFHRLSAAYGSLVTEIHLLLQGDIDSAESFLAQVQDINIKVLSIIDDFLKMARYDLNFLEQYYEHDFHSGLVNDHRFIEYLEDINHALQALTKQS